MKVRKEGRWNGYGRKRKTKVRRDFVCSFEGAGGRKPLGRKDAAGDAGRKGKQEMENRRLFFFWLMEKDAGILCLMSFTVYNTGRQF